MPSLGSQDCIEDAVEALQKGPFQYLIITGTGTESTRFDSCLDAQSRAMLLEWVRSGNLERLLLDHFEQNPVSE